MGQGRTAALRLDESMHFMPAIAARTAETDDQRRVAMGYVSEAFAEARLDGLDVDCIAQAAIFASLVEMVATYGEEASAVFAERLAERLRAGEFTVERSNH
jgi:predicted YcjX-like family ATPase